MSKTIDEVLEPFREEEKKQTYTVTRYTVRTKDSPSLFYHENEKEALEEMESLEKLWKDAGNEGPAPIRLEQETRELDFTNKYNVGDLVYDGCLEKAVITKVRLSYDYSEYLYEINGYDDDIWTEDDLEPYYTVEQEYEKLGYTREEFEEKYYMYKPGFEELKYPEDFEGTIDYYLHKTVKFTRLGEPVIASIEFNKAYDNKTSRVHKTVESYSVLTDTGERINYNLTEEELELQIRALNELEYFQPKGITKYNIISQGIKVYETLDKEEAEKMVEENNREVGEFNQKQRDNGDETFDNYFYISEEII